MSKLTLEEELELGRRVQQGDGDARNELIEANLNVVNQVLPKYASKKGVLVDDLIQEGRLGLLRAAESYHPKFKVPFAAHARSWVAECMRMHVVNCGHAIRVPHQTTRKFSKIEKYKAWYKSEHGRYPSKFEISKKLGIGKETQATIQECLPAINASNLEDDLMVRAREVDEDEIERFQAKLPTLRTALDQLPWIQRKYLERAFNVDHEGRETIEQLAERFESKPHRLKNLEAIALDHLKYILEKIQQDGAMGRDSVVV